jgi:anaerobic magnesium-protoporphyrin IX monomethyl ester cyclase
MAFNILLLNPPYQSAKGYNREGRCTQEAGFWSTPWPPFSLAMVAAVLRDKHRIRILDCPAQRITRARLLDDIVRNAPQVVIAAVSTETIESDLEILGTIKKRALRTTILVFGIHATVFAADIIGTGAVDFVIKGEPEETARELIAAIEAGSDAREVKGIAGRGASGETFSTEDRGYIQNLDELPFPAWDLVDLDRYRLPVSRRKFLIVNTLRGCPFRCSFCNTGVYYGTTARRRSVNNILDEIAFNIERHRVHDIFFWSDTFTLFRNQVQELGEGIIKKGLNIRWVANSRVDTVDPEILGLMRKAGCWLVSFGIESADDRILERCGKRITGEKIGEAVRWAKAAGLKTAGHFILGLPGETEATARATTRLAKTLGLEFAHFYSAVPYPGSALYDEALANGWLWGKEWSSFRQDEFVMELPGLAADTLYRLRRKAYHAFFFRAKTLKTALSLIALDGLLSSGKSAVAKLFTRRR